MDKQQIRELLDKIGTPCNIIYNSNKGISNNNYIIDNRYILKESYDLHFEVINNFSFKIQEEMNKFNFSPKPIYIDTQRGIFLSEYIPFYKPVEDITYLNIEKLVKILRKLHSLKIEGPHLDYEKSLDFYRLILPVRDRIYVEHLEKSPLLSKEQEISHFDLITDNLLVDRNSDLKLIDYEFCIYTPKYFDLTSLLFENNFPEFIQDSIINAYFKEDEENKKFYLDNKDEYRAIADLYWYHWAKARYLTSKKESFLNISIDKKNALFTYLRKKNQNI